MASTTQQAKLTRQTIVMLTDEVRDAIDVEARERGVTVSAVVRELIDAGLASRQPVELLVPSELTNVEHDPEPASSKPHSAIPIFPDGGLPPSALAAVVRRPAAG